MDKKQKILIVDDRVENLILLEKYLSEFNVNLIRALSGKEALSLIFEHEFALVLLDVEMPGMDGYETANLIRNNESTKYTPIIFVSAIYSETHHLIKGIESGAVDFIVKPIVPPILIGKVNIFLNLNRQHIKLEEEISKRIEVEKIMIKNIDYLKNTMKGMIQTLSLVVEAKDPYTAGHQKNVAGISVAIAKKMELKDDQIEGIRMAASIHDLGKIQTPSEILSKPGKITENEFELIKLHPEVGYEILKGIDFPWPIAEIIYQHHEKIDGSGYPNGLRNNDILLESKIISVADIVEAMSSHRPYRAALGIDVAIDELLDKKGTSFDTKIVDACVDVIGNNDNDILSIIKSGSDVNYN